MNKKRIIELIKTVRRDLSDLEDALGEFNADPETDYGRAVQAVAKAFGIPPSWITGRCREQEIIEARFALYFILSSVFNFSTVQIGRLIGMNHTAVCHGIRRAKQLAEIDARSFRPKLMAAKRAATAIEILPTDAAAVEEDGDEITTPMPNSCQRYSCKEHHPKLVNRDGFMVCPRCGVSYGQAR